MIPAVEIDLFTDGVEDAVHLATRGQLSAGYTGLLVGAERAWDLLARWRAACTVYAHTFGVALS